MGREGTRQALLFFGTSNTCLPSGGSPAGTHQPKPFQGGMEHSSLQLTPRQADGGLSAATSRTAGAPGPAAFPAMWQERSIRQGQKVLETSSAHVNLIPKDNFLEKGGCEQGLA